MKTLRLTRSSLKALGKNKLRSFLMMLGIIIGIATLTVIVSMTKGANKKIMARIRNFGPNAIMVHSGGGKMRGPATVSMANLTQRDLSDISSIEGVNMVAPFQVKLDMPIKYQERFTNSAVLGVMPNWADAWQRGASEGDFIQSEDHDGLKRVCVIGETVKNELFANTNPIGEDLLIGKVKFRVKGVLEKRGTSAAGTDFDNLILIPFSTASRRLMNQPKYIAMMRVIVNNPSHLNIIAKQIGQILRRNHHLASQEENDFIITTPTQIVRMIKGASKTLDTFLILVALVSLVVGGIVIANIMFISVNERTSEIGLRKAVGARSKDIMLQFLMETTTITAIGGIIGIIVGVLGAQGLALVTKRSASVSWEILVLGIVFSAVVGMGAGLLPAHRAASLNPISALRE